MHRHPANIMKKIIISALFAILISLPVTAYAAQDQPEDNDSFLVLETESQENETMDIEESLLEEKSKEEQTTLQDGPELTEEERDSGWTIRDGEKYPPEDVLMDGADISEVRDNDVCGYGVFKLYVPDGFQGDCHIEITNTSNYRTFDFKVNEANEYATTQRIPVGNYIVSGGGPVNDFASRYNIEKKTLTIQQNTTILVELTINERENRVQELQESKITPDKEEQPVVTLFERPEDNKIETNSPNSLLRELVLFVVVLIIIVVVLFFWKRSKTDKDE